MSSKKRHLLQYLIGGRGWVVSWCGPDEWEICVQAPELATEHEGETVFPVCFRDSSELRAAEPEAGS